MIIPLPEIRAIPGLVVLRTLVLVSALALWPLSATASATVPPSDASRVEAVGHDFAAHLLHCPGGFELHRISPHGVGVGVGPEERSTGSHLPGSGRLRVPSHTGGIAGPTAVTIDTAVPPLCEHLPYFATAPPALG